MAWYVYPAIIAAGFIAGFINTLAGSGSLITLPVLIFLGLPATVANGTNRVGILLQNIVGLGGFHRQDMLDLRGTIILGLPAIAGSLVGAQIAVNLDEEMMRRAIGLLMVVMLVVILVRPNRWLKGELTRLENWPGWSRMLLFFTIGIYGGFIQAGVGIFLLAGLVLGVGYDLVRANAIKVGIVLLFSISALLVFFINDQVDLFIGLILSVGHMLGAWVATQTAAQKGATWVRRLLIVVVAAAGANLLGVIEWVGGLF
jgi:uncharacterized membrane protein YfcA